MQSDYQNRLPHLLAPFEAVSQPMRLETYSVLLDLQQCRAGSQDARQVLLRQRYTTARRSPQDEPSVLWSCRSVVLLDCDSLWCCSACGACRAARACRACHSLWFSHSNCSIWEILPVLPACQALSDCGDCGGRRCFGGGQECRAGNTTGGLVPSETRRSLGGWREVPGQA
jgi:hypothetical protein